MSLSVAILGSGLAAEIHSKALRAVAPAVRRWYASRDAGRASRIASKWGGTGHFVTYEAALTNPDINAVIVAVPPALHLEWTRRALDAGKHVIVEKPPFLTTAELDEADAAARRAGRQLMVAENYFYKPLTALLRATIKRGDLGDVLFIQLNALKGQPTAGWRDDERLAGGGALFEGGIHWVSLLANIGLTPVRGRASFPSTHGAGGAGKAGKAEGARLRSSGTEASFGAARLRSSDSSPSFGAASRERNAVVTIEYAEGAVATLSYSWDLAGLINGVRVSRVYGTGGVLRFETNGLCAVLAGKRHRLFIPGLVDLAGYRAMMTDFISAIEQNRAPAYNLTLARRDLHLIEEAYASTSGSHHA
jgi:predicted dehydrogenase